MNYMVVITFWGWLFATDFFSLIYMSVYSHVPEVGTFLNWSPTLFSIASTLLLIGAFAWNYLVGWTLEMKLLLGASVTGLKFVSIIILTVLNALAVDDSKLNNDGATDQELRPGSQEDIESMIKILAIISSLYNWLMMLVTILLVICLIFDTKVFKFWKFNERRERKLLKIPEEEEEIAKLHARLQALKN